MSFLEWIEAHPGLSGWVQGLGTFVAALIAVYAAKVAYGGAVAQADATRDVYRQEVLDRQRAVAAVLWAELNDCRLRVRAMAQGLRSALMLTRNNLPLIAIPTEIYDANRNAIGHLPPLEAWQVVQCYKALQHIQGRISEITNSSVIGLSDKIGQVLVDEITRVVDPLEKILRELARTAGFPPDVNAEIDRLADNAASIDSMPRS